MTGTVILAKQLRASSIYLAPDRPAPSMVRVVCRIVFAGAATARRNAHSGALTQG